ncbi:MAG: hypothetical protein COX70_09625 [Flavobacteriales bacterium CG_4_10_14_0_2_um_filter_32_8]|nr:MAG: hypothetical protein COX70_09625 [Flavobacteriales bacterium CG_4_10_14_0_2_um_filter_32_8]PJB15043.1 MAG: hypothetical protein CO118_05470 [Flavobacteriales bacterium CG_4_9_14_3_um_filter_32_8]
MKKLTLYTTSILLALNSCSWNEIFVVKNNSDKSVTVSYKIEPLQKSGFAIFDDRPTLYGLNKKGNINWEKQITVTDTDTSQFKLTIILPPKSALIFGTLSNDHYKNQNQYFINGRHFNFNRMKIKKENEVITIVKDQFDDFFKKVKGEITFDIK